MMFKAIVEIFLFIGICPHFNVQSFTRRPHQFASRIENKKHFSRLHAYRQLAAVDEMFIVTPEQLSIELLQSQDTDTLDDDAPEGTDEKSWSKLWKKFAGDKETKKLKKKAPLLFIHGSYHSAWCFAENWFDYFSKLGHPCYAISLRGTSGTGMPPNDPGETVKIEQHVADIQVVLSSIIQRNPDARLPVIISHSFGGLITMKMLESSQTRQSLSGVALLCSVPPSGNGPMTLRFLRSRPCAALKIVYGFVLKMATTNVNTCRDLFFDYSVPEEDIRRYMRKFQSDSRVGLDLASLSTVLPSKTSCGPTGQATWLRDPDEMRPLPTPAPAPAPPPTPKAQATAGAVGAAVAMGAAMAAGALGDVGDIETVAAGAVGAAMAVRAVGAAGAVGASGAAVVSDGQGGQGGPGSVVAPRNGSAVSVYGRPFIGPVVNQTLKSAQSPKVALGAAQVNSTSVSNTSTSGNVTFQGPTRTQGFFGGATNWFGSFFKPDNKTAHQPPVSLPSTGVNVSAVAGTGEGQGFFAGVANWFGSLVKPSNNAPPDAFGSDIPADELFDMIDVDRSGYIEREELRKWLRKISKQLDNGSKNSEIKVTISSVQDLFPADSRPSSSPLAGGKGGAVKGLGAGQVARGSDQGQGHGRQLARLVVGGEADFIVDAEGVEETARYLGVTAQVVPRMYHDVMLGPRWGETAAIISEWLAEL